LEIKLDKRFQKKIKGLFGKYELEVGVLQDKPYRLPKKGERGLGGAEVISYYAGGPVREKSFKSSGKTVAEISKANRERLGFNYLSSPFENKSSDIIRFSRGFFDLVFGRSQKKRVENLLQAIVRNPILRGEYGQNSPLTQKIKGFDRSMIDTGQLFKSLKARVRVRQRV